MALDAFLYRCPLCGHDPVEPGSDQANSKSDLVFCPSCEASFAPGPPTGETRIRVSRKGRTVDVQATLLNRRIDRMGGATTRARQPDGRLRATAGVEAQFISDEDPLRFRDRLLGFIERLDDRVPGTLCLDGDHLEFVADDPRASSSELKPRYRWPVEGINSLQTSSSAVQISLGSRQGVVLFRFNDASVRRWDDLLRRTIRNRWKALGRGTVFEFQPRVRAR